MHRRFRAALATVVLALLLVTASASVAAQTVLSSSPIPAAPNTATTFVGAGFQPGEPVSLWTTAPDSTVVPLDGATAGIQGTVSASVTFPTAGTWNVTAHGQISGVQVVNTFAVGITTDTLPVSGTTLGALPTAPLQGGASALASPSTTYPQVAIGAPVIVTGSGLLANEPLSFWETGPNSAVTPLQGPQTADATGAFSLSIPFTTPGFWQVTAHGIISGHEVIGRYVVGDASSLPTALPGSGSAPAGTNATAATVGTTVTFTGSGFSAGERVSSWMTAPDSTVTALLQTVADSNGTATVTTAFLTAGGWQITLHGLDSGREVIGQYQVNR